MKKSLIALALVGAFAVPAFAEETPAAAEASPHTVTGNLTLATSYRFRGIDQTFGKPALQGGIDYSHASGFYVGNWNSNVSSGAGFPDGNLEMDFYGGWRGTFDDFGVDVGAIYYYYPGSEADVFHTRASGGAVNNKEVYVGASWKFLSLKYSYAFDDYFSMRGTANDDGKSTKGSSYLEFNMNYDLGDGWGINGHVGHFYAKNIKNGDYTDWKVGVTKDLSGWVVGLAYVDTNADGNCNKAFQPYCFVSSWDSDGQTSSSNKDAGRGIAVLSVTKSF
ncbi:MAG TPA: TorF family putative porin [Azonexus sp.]